MLLTIFEKDFIVDVRLGSKYASSVNHQMSDFVYKAHLQKNWTLRKSGPPTYRKSEPYAKIRCIDQKHLNDKLEVADFKYDNNFSLKLQPKQTFS